MKKMQTILFFLFIALFWSCSLVEHDEESKLRYLVNTKILQV